MKCAFLVCALQAASAWVMPSSLPSSRLNTQQRFPSPVANRMSPLQYAKVGLPAPDFSETALMMDGEFETVSLADYKGKYLVLLFYPLDFSFVCPTEIIAFSDAIERFREINTEVVACSVDSKYCHLAWTELPRNEGGLGEMDIPILADITKKIASDYGVLIEEGDDAGVALRGLFIISDKGVTRQATVNDLPVGRDVDETIRLIKAFQYNDENGDVCPAGWNPGDATLTPDPKKSKAYFEDKYEEE